MQTKPNARLHILKGKKKKPHTTGNLPQLSSLI